MKNKMSDLHNHLFEQLERLNDTNLKGEGLREEIRRAEAMNKVAGQIISNGNLILRAAISADSAIGDMNLPLLLDKRGEKQTAHNNTAGSEKSLLLRR